MKKIFHKMHVSLFLVILGGFLCSPLSADIAGRLWVGGVRLYDIPKNQSVKYKTGVAAGMSAGCSMLCFTRFEVEGIYLYNPLQNIEVSAKNAHMKGSVRDYALFANLVLQIPGIFWIKPYAGGGVGYSHGKMTIHGEGVPKHTKKQKRLAYQFLGGVCFPIDDIIFCSASLFIEGRWIAFQKQAKAALFNGGLAVSF